MTRKLMAIMVLGAGAMLAQYRDGYGQPGYGDPRYDPQNGPGYNDPYYDDGYVMQPQAPPAVLMYGPSFRRPPMPGRGYMWVDGYWTWMRGRYVWVAGYWTLPPYAGAYWVAPRHSGGRFFFGFWGGGSRGGYGYNGGFGYGGRERGHGYGHGNRGGGYGYRR